MEQPDRKAVGSLDYTAVVEWELVALQIEPPLGSSVAMGEFVPPYQY